MMNLKNRLEKLEDKLNFNSEVCHCPREIVFKIVPFEERIEETETICETCRKPIPKHPPVTFSLNGNIEYQVIKPTTNYTREEFEQFQNEHVMSQHSTYEAYLAEKENI